MWRQFSAIDGNIRKLENKKMKSNKIRSSNTIDYKVNKLKLFYSVIMIIIVIIVYLIRRAIMP